MNLQRFQRLGGGVKLANSAVNQDQPGQISFLLEDSPIAARDRFAHAQKVIVEPGQVGGASVFSAASFPANDEFPVVRFFHPSFSQTTMDATVSVPWI